jgi:hypothetical protein
MLDRRYSEFLGQIGFTLIQPETAQGPRRQFVLERDDRPPVTLLEIFGFPIDVPNSTFGSETAALHRKLRPLANVPRMSTHAVAAIINRGVGRMAPGSAFVNVGVWHGYTLLSGMAGNRERTCIGVDNFTEFGGPREPFVERFEKQRSPNHHFHEMDYEDYFTRHHRGAIGLYFYDGDHAYDHQLRGLQVAERFFDDDCVVIVDDTNWDEPREAALEFIARSERNYAMLLDARTAISRHPTFWNGLMVFQATSASRDAPSAPRTFREAHSRGDVQLEPARIERDSLVSLIVCDDDADSDALGATLELALGQTWRNVEVLAVESSPDKAVRETIRRFGNRVVSVPSSGTPGAGARAGIANAHGQFVAVVDSHWRLDEAAVEKGLARCRNW